MPVDNTQYAAVINSACTMNRKLIQQLDRVDMDPLVRETIKAALEGNLLITKMTEHHLEVLDLLEKLVATLNNK